MLKTFGIEQSHGSICMLTNWGMRPREFGAWHWFEIKESGMMQTQMTHKQSNVWGLRLEKTLKRV